MKRDWQNASERGDAATLSHLIDQGLDIDARDRYGQTALMLAARNGHLEATQLLVSAGADLDHTAKYHLSALMLAVINDRTSIIKILILAGADTEIRGTGAPGFSGRTAFDLAKELGRESASQLLEPQ